MRPALHETMNLQGPALIMQRISLTRPPGREASLAKGAFQAQVHKTALLARRFGPKGPRKCGVRSTQGWKAPIYSGPGRPPGGPGRSSCVCIIRDVPAWQVPCKVSGVLTCPWAPLLPLLTAFWPAHSLQLHSKHQQASVGRGPFLKINKKVACMHFVRLGASRNAWFVQPGR